MPRDFLFTRAEILDVAVDMTRECGIDAVTARALGRRLGTSSQPIFGHFKNMDEVKGAVIEESMRRHKAYILDEIAKGEYPPYKASGMAYIQFAIEEPELFKLLFLGKKAIEGEFIRGQEIDIITDIICKQVAISKEQAQLFYLEMWTYTHGIATMIATNYYHWDTELISKSLTDMYVGLKYRYEHSNDVQ